MPTVVRVEDRFLDANVYFLHAAAVVESWRV